MEFTYLIDVVGTCNLSCPSCPVGNMGTSDFQGGPRKKGFMTLDLFTAVVDRIVADSAAAKRPFCVHLYNWGEPMLHPDFDRICRILAERKVKFYVSSNMNHETSFTQLARHAFGIRASTSGFTNKTYQRTHRGGDINLFISNLYRLRYTIDKVKSNPIVDIYYHVYKDNCDEDMKRLEALCGELGYHFSPAYAYFMGLEKYLYHLEGSAHFTEQDQAIADKMLFSIEESMEVAKYAQQSDCRLRQLQTVINHDGSVPVCCTVFDPANFVTNDFLSLSFEELHERKMDAAICEPCMSRNLHNVAIYEPSAMFEDLATMRQLQNRQKYIARQFSKPHVSEVHYTEDGNVIIV